VIDDDQVMCNCWNCRTEILYGQPHFARDEIWPGRKWCSEPCFTDWQSKLNRNHEQLSQRLMELNQRLEDHEYLVMGGWANDR